MGTYSKSGCLVLATVLLAACRASVRRDVPTANPPRAFTGTELCAVLTATSNRVHDEAVARRRATYDAALARGEVARGADGKPEPFALPRRHDDLPKALGSCYPYATGAWALQLEALDLGPYTDRDGTSARWSVVHADAQSHLSRIDIETSAKGEEGSSIENANCCNSGHDDVLVGNITVFDFDGDGTPEFFLHVDSVAHHGYAERKAYFLRFSSGGISDLESGFDELEDVDGDGRPDGIETKMEEDTSDPNGNFVQRRVRRSVSVSKPDGRFELRPDLLERE